MSKRLLLCLIIWGSLAAFAPSSLAADTVQLNEVMLSTAEFIGGKAYEWVELHNPTDASVSLGGWKLRWERKGETQEYTIPSGRKIDKNGYSVIWLTGLD